MKYIVDQDQMTTISGIINDEASQKYAGTYLNEPIKLEKDFLIFEHVGSPFLVRIKSRI